MTVPWVGQLKACSIYRVTDTIKLQTFPQLWADSLLTVKQVVSLDPFMQFFFLKTAAQFQTPYSNATVGPSKMRGELCCLYLPVLSKEAFPRNTRPSDCISNQLIVNRSKTSVHLGNE